MLATASTPVVRIANEGTLARYVERLQSVLATGSADAQRTFPRAWIPRIEVDGMRLTVTFTLPGGNPPATPASQRCAAGGTTRSRSARRYFLGAWNFLPPVANGDPKGIFAELEAALVVEVVG